MSTIREIHGFTPERKNCRNQRIVGIGTRQLGHKDR